jgi:drug/metabolite transporter (DMT)-like permease
MSRLIYVFQGSLAGFLFGTASIFIRLLPRLDALSLGFARLTLAAIFMFLMAVTLERQSLKATTRVQSRLLLLLGSFLGLHFVFFITAVKNTSIVNATTLVNTTPAMTLVISWILRQASPSKVNILGLLITLSGITSMSLAEFSISPSNILGDVSALGGAFFWALYLTFGKDLRERASPVTVMPSLYLLSALVLAAAAYLVGGGLLLPVTAELPPLLAVAFIPTVLGHTLHFSSLKGLKSFEASTLALLEPVVASVLAFLVFGEAPAASFYLSAAVTLLGIYLVLR